MQSKINRSNPDTRILEKDEKVREYRMSERKQEPTRSNRDQKTGNVLFNTTRPDVPLHVTYIHFEQGWALKAGRKFLSTPSHGTATPDSCFGCNYKSCEAFLSNAQLNCSSRSTEKWNTAQLLRKNGKACFSEQNYG